MDACWRENGGNNGTDNSGSTGSGNSGSSGNTGNGNATNAETNNSQNQSGILFPIAGETGDTEEYLISLIKTTGKEKNYELIKYINDVNREYAEVLVEQNINGAMDGLYGSVSALTFYGTGLAYERVTAPKLPNTYIRDRLAAAEEMGRSEGCSNVTPQNVMCGNDWNNYFRETYGYENVNWETAFDSFNDIIEMPSSVTRMNPTGLYNYLNEAGLDVGPLGQGENIGINFLEGGGFNTHFRTQYGDSYIQYNPSSVHHGGVAYYKVSSGNTFLYMGSQTGTQRFYLDGGLVNDW